MAFDSRIRYLKSQHHTFIPAMYVWVTVSAEGKHFKGVALLITNYEVNNEMVQSTNGFAVLHKLLFWSFC